MDIYTWKWGNVKPCSTGKFNWRQRDQSTGEHPQIKLGVLLAIQKHGKPVGLTSLSHIVLPFMLRKSLVIVIIDRIWDIIQSKLLVTQATHRTGHNTTGDSWHSNWWQRRYLFENYGTFILMMDMSWIFDTVDKKLLIYYLQFIPDNDELHIVRLLLEDISLSGNSKMWINIIMAKN